MPMYIYGNISLNFLEWEIFHSEIVDKVKTQINVNFF